MNKGSRLAVKDHFSNEACKFHGVQRMINGKLPINYSKKVISDPFGEFVAYRLSYCVEEGDRGDSDGFGVEPDTWIAAFAHQDESLRTPFYSLDEPAFANEERRI